MRWGEKVDEESDSVGDDSGEDGCAGSVSEAGGFARLRGVRWPAAGCRAGEAGRCLVDEGAGDSADIREACELLARFSVADMVLRGGRWCGANGGSAWARCGVCREGGGGSGVDECCVKASIATEPIIYRPLCSVRS